MRNETAAIENLELNYALQYKLFLQKIYILSFLLVFQRFVSQFHNDFRYNDIQHLTTFLCFRYFVAEILKFSL